MGGWGRRFGGRGTGSGGDCLGVIDLKLDDLFWFCFCRASHAFERKYVLKVKNTSFFLILQKKDGRYDYDYLDILENTNENRIHQLEKKLHSLVGPSKRNALLSPFLQFLFSCHKTTRKPVTYFRD